MFLKWFKKEPVTVKNHQNIGNKVILDPGHGGYDWGLRTGHIYNKGYNGILEKNINLEIANRVAWLCSRHGIRYLMTRWGDRYISLPERCKIANQTKANVLISFHCNYSQDEHIKGVEVYNHPRSMRGMKYAKKLQDLLVEINYTKNRYRKAEEFFMLRKTRMPAILVEFGFLSNKNDAIYLNNENNQTLIAVKVWELIKGIVQGDT